jgi:hypothetical protein
MQSTLKTTLSSCKVLANSSNYPLFKNTGSVNKSYSVGLSARHMLSYCATFFLTIIDLISITNKLKKFHSQKSEMIFINTILRTIKRLINFFLKYLYLTTIASS